MRGAQRKAMDDLRDKRIIPADAGSTRPVSGVHDRRGDHPRGCGEHTASPVDICSPEGSSPRMRGALGRGICHRQRCRIIPADAGSTFTIRLDLTGEEDHPRGCGEHASVKFDVLDAPGSSPRMRGAPTLRAVLLLTCRIIPADAGSTVSRAASPSRRGDHPRGCGEHPRPRVRLGA